ncbi:MAG: sel1 repeat family protein, partial [Rhodospirillales bacterium]|nr:sel1 repeat family protein [Rhodospirillales bacterium]
LVQFRTSEDDPEASYYLGIMSEKGQGTFKSLSQAWLWYMKAAEKKHVPSMVKVAHMFEVGSGIPRDLKTAGEWYKRAAESGSIKAQFHYGEMLVEGYGITRDIFVGARWLYKAAEAGHAGAQARLDELYRTGVLTREQVIFGVDSEAKEIPPLTKSGRILRDDLFTIAKASWLAPIFQSSENLGAEVKFGGDVLTLEKDGELTALFPFMKIVYSDENSTDFGTVRVKIKPEKEDLYRVSVTFPGRIVSRQRSGLVSSVTAFDEFQLEALWSKKYFALQELSVRLSSFQNSSVLGAGNIEMDKFTYDFKLSEGESGRWNGPNTFEISGLRFVSNDKQSSLNMENVSRRGETKGFSYDRYLKFRTDLGFNPVTGTWQTDIFSKGIKVPEFYPLYGQSDWNELSIGNIEVVSDGKPVFKLEKASFGITAQGLEEPIGKFGYKAGFKGIAFAVDNSELKSMIPNAVTLDFSIDNYPQQLITSQSIESLVRIFSFFKTFEQFGDVQSADMMMNLLSAYQKSFQDIQANYYAKMVAAMFDAGTEYILNGMTLESPKYFVQAEGHAKMDRNAVRKAAGAFSLAVTGLDQIVTGSALSTLLGDDEQSLAFLRDLGKEEKGADGKVVTRFRFDVTPEGPIFLNGEDVSKVFKTLKAY